MWDQELEDAIEGAGLESGQYMTTFDEISDYYKDEYGQRNYIRAMVEALTGKTPNDGRAYQSARRRIERWADGSTKPNAKGRAELVKLGLELPALEEIYVPDEGIEVSVKARFRVSKKQKNDRERTISVTLTGIAAYDFLKNPTYEQIFEAYQVDGRMFAEGMSADHTVSIN